MIRYQTNRKYSLDSPKQQTFQNLLNPIVHSHVEQMYQMQSEKNEILNKLTEARRDKIQSLLIDPSELGRYRNYRGASSQIANYLKGLEKSIRDKFIPDASPTRLNGYSHAQNNYNLIGKQQKQVSRDDSPKKLFYAQKMMQSKYTPQVKFQNKHLSTITDTNLMVYQQDGSYKSRLLHVVIEDELSRRHQTRLSQMNQFKIHKRNIIYDENVPTSHLDRSVII